MFFFFVPLAEESKRALLTLNRGFSMTMVVLLSRIPTTLVMISRVGAGKLP